MKKGNFKIGDCFSDCFGQKYCVVDINAFGDIIAIPILGKISFFTSDDNPFLKLCSYDS